ncbi:hypothetical protein [Mesorhizobium carmichaelinearum]|uniref:hypothetical protein n=1 Tax=Mesorhizobium carmichaelinearum TaxID=1208188 RepID=UPI0015C74BFE|nr:hypothetical protein [Mesorhizobium carmichaelinearum]
MVFMVSSQFAYEPFSFKRLQFCSYIRCRASYARFEPDGGRRLVRINNGERSKVTWPTPRNMLEQLTGAAHGGQKPWRACHTSKSPLVMGSAATEGSQS